MFLSLALFWPVYKHPVLALEKDDTEDDPDNDLHEWNEPFADENEVDTTASWEESSHEGPKSELHRVSSFSSSKRSLAEAELEEFDESELPLPTSPGQFIARSFFFFFSILGWVSNPLTLGSKRARID
jgi:hypothetical protein